MRQGMQLQQLLLDQTLLWPLHQKEEKPSKNHHAEKRAGQTAGGKACWDRRVMVCPDVYH